jgi:DNA end-binding protein Ku
MPRAIWKGAISFGLVQIRVGLHAAEHTEELSLTLLDKRNFSPIGYERVNRKTGRKVEWKDVVKGYEYSKGEYVVLDKADFEAANVEATQTIDIQQFVEQESIDVLYYERPYFLAPEKNSRKAYALLRATLERTKMLAIAKVVIRTRQHLAAMLPWGDALALVLMRFPHELRDASELDLPNGNLKKLGVSPQELKMAQALVDGMTGKWEPERYRDEYRDDLLQLIDEKAERGELNTLATETPRRKKPAAGAQVIDLMDLLKQSLEKKPAKRAKASRAKNGKAKGPRKARGDAQLRKSA